MYETNKILVRNVDTGIVYNSLTEAAQSCNGRKGDICDCCNGNQHTAFGYRWEYVNPEQRRRKSIHAKVQNVETGEIFADSKQAALSCNGDSRKINEVCYGKHKTYHGFHWIFVDEEH